MKIEFQKDPSLKSDEITVEIKAASENTAVKELVAHLQQFGRKERNLLAIKTNERIVTIKYAEIIKIEVQATNLTYFTRHEIIKSTGRLYQVKESLNEDFIQVSRHAVININYLESIEAGFAGNMIAILANNLRADVSRRYLPLLEKELGL